MLLNAFRQFRARRLESLLIIVAIALGTSIVTAVAAFLGLNQQAKAQFEASLASREITLEQGEGHVYFPADVDVRKVPVATGGPATFTLHDLEQAKAAAPSVAYAYVEDTRLLATAKMSAGQSLKILGVSKDYLAAARVKVRAGSLFAPSDFEKGRNVMLATPEDVERLGIAGDAVGQSVVFDGVPGSPTFTIIGVLAEPFDTSLVPFSSFTLDSYLSLPHKIKELRFAVSDTKSLGTAQSELEAFAQHHWGGGVVVSTNSFTGQVSRQQLLTSLVIAIFASIGLVVASLNIMNLMLARVLKRGRDIGINRSLGATRGMILKQYLTEALTLGVIGGLVGIPVGYALLSIYNRYIGASANGQVFHLAFSVTAMLIGLGLAIGVSLLFGLYPAILAARVRIVEALREA